ncbi:MAG: hypothetical protein MMC33_007812 [Icmadophila ericetorum]|nr:hypothetical protein [Icmadophila ericetorum]
MAQRPVALQSQYIRLLCPLKRSQRRTVVSDAASLTSREWSNPPISSNATDDSIARLAAKPMHPLTLSDLVKHGHPPLSAEKLFSSANFTLSILPIRLAHRIQALRNLPFIVVSNPNVARIYNTYLHSLSTLLPYQEKSITNLEDEIQFTEVMADLVQTHSNTIPILARGFLECRKYISPSDVTHFLDEHLRARIGTRLIAEQHIALHLSSQPHSPKPQQSSQSSKPSTGGTSAGGTSFTSHPLDRDPPSSYIGVIDTALRPAEIIRNCESFVSEICELKYGVRPSVVIHGQVEMTLAHVPTHLEYIITELLKNAFRATVESGREREPVEVTIASSSGCMENRGSSSVPDSSPGSGVLPPSSSNDSMPGLTIRIRDRGGGISPTHLPHIWSYSFTTFNARESNVPSALPSIDDALQTLSGVAGGDARNSLAGLGYGLPLGRAYAEYFGGGISVQSLWGWGTDVYLRLRGLGGF